jgi:chromosome segregation ATPase
MAKLTKVKYDESDDCRSNDKKDYSKDELIEIYEQLSTSYEKKRKECKALQKELKALKQSFDELQTSHECPKEDHEELGLAHTKCQVSIYQGTQWMAKYDTLHIC